MAVSICEKTSRLRASNSYAMTPNEKTSIFSLYGWLLRTSGAYMDTHTHTHTHTSLHAPLLTSPKLLSGVCLCPVSVKPALAGCMCLALGAQRCSAPSPWSMQHIPSATWVVTSPAWAQNAVLQVQASMHVPYCHSTLFQAHTVHS